MYVAYLINMHWALNFLKLIYLFELEANYFTIL